MALQLPGFISPEPGLGGMIASMDPELIERIDRSDILIDRLDDGAVFVIRAFKKVIRRRFELLEYREVIEYGMTSAWTRPAVCELPKDFPIHMIGPTGYWLA